MKFAIIGAGNMGGALARGLAQGTRVKAEDITVSNPSPAKLEQLKEEYPKIGTTTDNRQCVAEADVVVLAVKPWKLAEVAAQLSPILDSRWQRVCSMVGGIGLDRLEELFPLMPLYYLIPNTAIATRQSMTFIASRHTTPQADSEMLAILRELGDAMLVEERLMNAGLVLASCGIAYALRYIRANTQGGVLLGFTPADAQRIVAQTMKGAASLLGKDGSHPESEIDKVTTPAGLTIRGLNAMERNGFTTSIIEGLMASIPQSK